MKFVFKHYPVDHGPYPCPFGNYAGGASAPFLHCNGIKGLIEKLRKLLS